MIERGMTMKKNSILILLGTIVYLLFTNMGYIFQTKIHLVGVLLELGIMCFTAWVIGTRLKDNKTSTKLLILCITAIGLASSKALRGSYIDFVPFALEQLILIFIVMDGYASLKGKPLFVVECAEYIHGMGVIPEEFLEYNEEQEDEDEPENAPHVMSNYTESVPNLVSSSIPMTDDTPIDQDFLEGITEATPLEAVPPSFVTPQKGLPPLPNGSLQTPKQPVSKGLPPLPSRK